MKSQAQEIEILKETTNNLSDWNHRQQNTLKELEAETEKLKADYKAVDCEFIKLEGRVRTQESKIKTLEDGKASTQVVRGVSQVAEWAEKEVVDLKAQMINEIIPYQVRDSNEIKSLTEKIERLEKESKYIKRCNYEMERLTEHDERLNILEDKLETKKPNPQPTPEEVIKRARKYVERWLDGCQEKPWKDEYEMILAALDIATNSLRGE